MESLLLGLQRWSPRVMSEAMAGIVGAIVDVAAEIAESIDSGVDGFLNWNQFVDGRKRTLMTLRVL